jgi:hypothetical protein
MGFDIQRVVWRHETMGISDPEKCVAFVKACIDTARAALDQMGFEEVVLATEGGYKGMDARVFGNAVFDVVERLGAGQAAVLRVLEIFDHLPENRKAPPTQNEQIVHYHRMGGWWMKIRAVNCTYNPEVKLLSGLAEQVDDGSRWIPLGPRRLSCSWPKT